MWSEFPTQPEQVATLLSCPCSAGLPASCCLQWALLLSPFPTLAPSLVLSHLSVSPVLLYICSGTPLCSTHWHFGHCGGYFACTLMWLWRECRLPALCSLPCPWLQALHCWGKSVPPCTTATRLHLCLHLYSGRVQHINYTFPLYFISFSAVLQHSALCISDTCISLLYFLFVIYVQFNSYYVYLVPI